MNVIVVVCNSLHLGFLGAYGNPWIETPNLDRLAAEGIVFDHHFPENLTTLPTRRSWWTGRYGFADPDQGWTPLRPDEAILPDMLVDKGVRTALISDVPVSARSRAWDIGRGFDEVIWVRGQGYDPLVPPGDPRAQGVRLEDEPGLRLPDDDDETARTLEEAMGAIPPQSGRAQNRSRREHGGRADREGRDRLARAARKVSPTPSCSGSICLRRMGRGTRPSRFATST